MVHGLSADSFLTVLNDTIRRIPTDSLPNIYNKNGEIKEKRVVKIKTGHSLSFTGGRVEIDTLLVRKRKLGLSTDTFMVTFKDTVRKIPADSLWNIYTKDGKLINTKDHKRNVDLDGQKLIFKDGKTTTNSQQNAANNNGAVVGIIQTNPKYTLDIATKSFMKNKTNSNSNYDSIAVRIAHNVPDNNSNENGSFKYGYGLVLSEFSKKKQGRSTIGFQGGDENSPWMKAGIWAQGGINGQSNDKKSALLGFSTSDGNNLKPRMFINKDGNVMIGPVVKSNINGNDQIRSRLVVNTPKYAGKTSNDAYNGLQNTEIAIIANTGANNDGNITYGLLVREASYKTQQVKLALGFMVAVTEQTTELTV